MLDTFRRRLADQRTIVAADIVDDRLVESIAADAHGLRIDDTVQGNHGDLRGAAANVEHHGAAGLAHGHSRADGRRHGLLDEKHLAGSRAGGGFADGAPLHLRGSAGHAHQHPGTRAQELVLVSLVDEMLEHLLGDSEVGDDTVLERPDGHDVAGCAPEHALRGFAHGGDVLGTTWPPFLANRDHRWLVENDALSAHVDESIGRTEIDGEVVGKNPPNALEHQDLPWLGVAITNGLTRRV